MVKSVTMAELRKAKPPSPKELHQSNVGKGNFNRWNALGGGDGRRPSISGKRQLESSSPPPSAPQKAPRLDPNLLFEQMKAHEGKLTEAETILNEAVQAKADADLDNNNLLDDGTNSCISKMLLVLTALISHQKGLSSSFVDFCKENSSAANSQKGKNPPPNWGADQQLSEPPRGRSGTISQKKPLTDEEITRKKVKQEIMKAEKSTTLFDLDLGQVPIINKDTLSSKVTRAIHAAAANGDEAKKGNYSPEETEEIMDDILTCAHLDFLGNGGSKKYYNKAKPNDPKNGKFCTVPTKLTFRSKEERTKAEQTLRKFGKIKCSIPYPKKLRTIIGDVVKKGKELKPNCYIRTKVDTDKMLVVAHASFQNEAGRWVWEDLHLDREIPLDVLDKPDQVTLERDSEQIQEQNAHSDPSSGMEVCTL